MKYLIALALVACISQGEDDDTPVVPNMTPGGTTVGVHTSTQADAGVRLDAEQFPPIDARPDAPPPADAS